jgi:hypothetical protein
MLSLCKVKLFLRETFFCRYYTLIKHNVNDDYFVFRCSSAISVVPPIAYAHLLAARARLYPTIEVPGEQNCEESESISSIPLVSKELAKVMYFV